MGYESANRSAWFNRLVLIFTVPAILVIVVILPVFLIWRLPSPIETAAIFYGVLILFAGFSVWVNTTPIEAIVTVVIMSILLALLTPAVYQAREAARQAKIQQEQKQAVPR